MSLPPRRPHFFRTLGLCLSFLGATSLVAAASTQDLLREAVKLYERSQYDLAREVFEQVLTRDPQNAEAREYLLRAAEKTQEASGNDTASTYDPRPAPKVDLDQILGGPSGTPEVDEEMFRFDADRPVDSRDLLRQQQNLKDNYRNRTLSVNEIIEVKRSGGRTDITFFLNRLFFPFTEVLSPEAHRALRETSEVLRREPDGNFRFTAIDNLSPAVRHLSGDLASRRTGIIFTYLLDLTHPEISRPSGHF